MSKEVINRKTFLKMGYGAFLDAVSSVFDKGMAALNKRPHIRPPGAVEESAFMTLCNICGKCWEGCPHGAIKQAEDDGGLAGGTPVIVPRDVPCYLCAPPVCSQVCPEGALKPITSSDIRIGIARVSNATCLAHQGIDRNCNYCYDRCPLKDKAIVFKNGPFVSKEFCTGCGICEFFCVSNPKSIVVSPV